MVSNVRYESYHSTAQYHFLTSRDLVKLYSSRKPCWLYLLQRVVLWSIECLQIAESRFNSKKLKGRSGRFFEAERGVQKRHEDEGCVSPSLLARQAAMQCNAGVDHTGGMSGIIPTWIIFSATFLIIMPVHTCAVLAEF